RSRRWRRAAQHGSKSHRIGAVPRPLTPTRFDTRMRWTNHTVVATHTAAKTQRRSTGPTDTRLSSAVEAVVSVWRPGHERRDAGESRGQPGVAMDHPDPVGFGVEPPCDAADLVDQVGAKRQVRLGAGRWGLRHAEPVQGGVG